jgi:hypothetical protein
MKRVVRVVALALDDLFLSLAFVLLVVVSYLSSFFFNCPL